MTAPDLRDATKTEDAGGYHDRRLLGVGGVSGVAFVVATWFARRQTPGWGEIAVFQAVNGLPGWLYYGVWPFMQYGVFATIPISAGVAALFRRYRLAVLLLLTSGTIYVLAKVVKHIAQRGRPMDFLDTVYEREHFAVESLGYTSGHVAVAAAITTLSWFHLPGWVQRITVALVAIVAFGRMYVGAHLPLDMIGGIAMGICAGCLVTYAFGDRATRLRAAPPRRR